MSTEEKVTLLEQSIAIVTRLLENHSNRLDTHMDWINQLGASQARHDAWLVEMSAAQAQMSVAQAQMSAAHVELRAAQAENERRIAQLIDEHIRTDDKFRELAESQRRTDAKVFDTDARLDRIAEAVERMTRNGRERPEG